MSTYSEEDSYLMKKEAAAEVGWLEDMGAAGPYWTGLLCLDVVRETVEMDVSEGRGCSLSATGPCV